MSADGNANLHGCRGQIVLCLSSPHFIDHIVMGRMSIVDKRTFSREIDYGKTPALAYTLDWPLHDETSIGTFVDRMCAVC